MTEFVKGRKGIMLCYPFEEKRLAKWEPPYVVQPKLDGERCRATITPSGAVMLLSSQENVICSVPHINEALEKMSLPAGTELDGELYVHDSDFEDIHSMVGRTVNLHPMFARMEYHVFDIINEDAQIKRLVDLKQLSSMSFFGPIKMVPYHMAESLDDIMRVYDKYIDLGYEGIIVRHWMNLYVRRRSTYMMKFKPKKSDTYQIIGTAEEISQDGEPKGTLGALICMGDDGTEFRVGTGFTAEQRRDLWQRREELPGKSVEVSYQHRTSANGVPRFPVFCEVLE